MVSTSDAGRKWLFGRPGGWTVLALAFGLCSAWTALGAMAEHWVGTWGCGAQLTESSNLPLAPLANSTLRQFVHVSLGGKHLRARFSNAFGTNSVTMNSVHVALASGRASATDGGINPATDKALNFQGASRVTIPPGEIILSDPVEYDLPPLTNLAVTIFFGDISGSTLTGHPGSRTTSFVQSGNAISATNLPAAAKTVHWYILTGIDVLSDQTAGALVV